MIKKALKEDKIGYGKMDSANPKADAFYENILSLGVSKKVDCILVGSF